MYLRPYIIVRSFWGGDAATVIQYDGGKEGNSKILHHTGKEKDPFVTVKGMAT